MCKHLCSIQKQTMEALHHAKVLPELALKVASIIPLHMEELQNRKATQLYSKMTVGGVYHLGK